mgnify:CR=1 FL=1
MEKLLLPQNIKFHPDEAAHKGSFIVEPCYYGYGVTLGNALRRVLLSSLPGGAVTTIRIEGAQHEFSSLPHVKEDLVEIILNFKLLRLKVFSEDGKEMPMIRPVTTPLVPTGSMTAKKGEVLRVGIYTLAFVQPLKPGSYYAIATFSDAFCGEQNVRFTTQKRWFEIRNAKPKTA